MRYAYPVEVREDADGITVLCPDVPEMVTGGWGDRAANLDAAADALVTALSTYVEDRRPVPRPSAGAGRPVVPLPLLSAAKLALHETRLRAGLSDAELGRRLGLDAAGLAQLLDLLAPGDLTAVETALRQLGRHLVVDDLAA